MCPGRTAARSAAAQIRDRLKLQASDGPASAVHRCALHRVRDTPVSKNAVAHLMAHADRCNKPLHVGRMRRIGRAGITQH
jgi:hypothetical protein